MNDLQANTKENLLNTLKYFTAAEEQRRYKSSVPFVHVPNEIVAQWDSYRRVRDKDWYIQIWEPAELEALDNFGKILDNFLGKCEGKLNDVPEILENLGWIAVMEAAAPILVLL